jgi:hypothetical protein
MRAALSLGQLAKHPVVLAKWGAADKYSGRFGFRLNLTSQTWLLQIAAKIE